MQPRDFLENEMGTPVTESFPGRDFLQESQPKESLSTSIAMAAPRLGEDILRGGANFLKSIPQYYESAKTEIPGAFNVMKNSPGHAGSQAMAGLSELGQNVFNTPHDVINYLSQRLNLVPEDINKMVQMGRMPSDTQNAINQTFGEVKEPGEALIRGLPRNALNIMAAKPIASALNPLNLTSGGIARNVLKETEKQISKHSNMYNKIWNKAEKSGFNQVPIDKNLLSVNHEIIDKFYPEKSTMALKAFMEEPTLAHAQAAQSDLGNLRRALEEKSRTTPLLETEKALHKVLSESEKHIENNMFKNAKGEINKGLQNEYGKVTKSYRKNVVPYRYHPAIQAYKAEEITAPELVNALSRGEFARKKGYKHPALKINKAFPLIGTLGTGALGGYLAHELLGNKTPENQ
jgi:hypothetical protein